MENENFMMILKDCIILFSSKKDPVEPSLKEEELFIQVWKNHQSYGHFPISLKGNLLSEKSEKIIAL